MNPAATTATIAAEVYTYASQRRDTRLEIDSSEWQCNATSTRSRYRNFLARTLQSDVPYMLKYRASILREGCAGVEEETATKSADFSIGCK